MNIFTFLLSLALLSVGFAGGIAFMSIFYSDMIKELRAQNRQLRQNVLMLKRMKKDTVEIIYPKHEPENLFDPF